jgi:hypothetical protein
MWEQTCRFANSVSHALAHALVKKLQLWNGEPRPAQGGFVDAVCFVTFRTTCCQSVSKTDGYTDSGTPYGTPGRWRKKSRVAGSWPVPTRILICGRNVKPKWGHEAAPF